METIISWTNVTWNPVTGCSKVSDGCRYCYAERISLSKGWTKLPWTARNASQNVRIWPERLKQPFGYKPGTRCFVNSMSDLFHEAVPDDFIKQVFEVMRACHHVTFQVLTKRSARLRDFPIRFPSNVWIGVSVEDDRVLHRVDDLRSVNASVRFLSCEPLIGPLDELDLTGIHWVIVGGESGPNHRPMDMRWVRAIRDKCATENVPFFFKQDAGYRTELRPYVVEEDGRHTTIQQYPSVTTANMATLI